MIEKKEKTVSKRFADNTGRRITKQRKWTKLERLHMLTNKIPENTKEYRELQKLLERTEETTGDGSVRCKINSYIFLLSKSRGVNLGFSACAQEDINIFEELYASDLIHPSWFRCVDKIGMKVINPIEMHNQKVKEECSKELQLKINEVIFNGKIQNN